MTPQEFFDAMRFFGEPAIPENTDPSAILGAYLRGLGRYSAEIRQRAADQIMHTRNYRNFPLLAECMDACRDAQDALAAEAKRGKLASKAQRPDPWSDKRLKQADGMIAGDLGRLAAQEGWIIELHDFCREEERLPTKIEAEKIHKAFLRRKAERERRARLFGGNPKIIRTMARAMEAKTVKLSKIANGAEA